MSFKLSATRNKAIQLVQEYHRSQITDMVKMTRGETSSAYSYKVRENSYIIRISGDDYGFAKDRFAYSVFGGSGLNIPKIIHIGNSGDLCFCISKKLEGSMLENLDKTDLASVQPQIMLTLKNIHMSDISGTNGFGEWAEDGNASADSWHDVLLSITSSEDKPSYWIDWNELISETFFEVDLFRFLVSKIEQNIDKCPNGRYLLHGDFSLDNIIGNKDRVSGVIDWADSMYGDFLYDIAYFALHNGDECSLDQYLEIIDADTWNLQNIDDRISCYYAYSALDALGFYAKVKRKSEYHKTKSKVLELLK